MSLNPIDWSAGAVFRMSGGFTPRQTSMKPWRSGWWRRSGLGGTYALYSWQCLASAKGNWKRVYHAQWHFQMQLSWGPGLLHQWHIPGKEIHNFVKVVDHNLPVLPLPSKSSPTHTNSSNRYRLYAYFQSQQYF